MKNGREVCFFFQANVLARSLESTDSRRWYAMTKLVRGIKMYALAYRVSFDNSVCIYWMGGARRVSVGAKTDFHLVVRLPAAGTGTTSVMMTVMTVMQNRVDMMIIEMIEMGRLYGTAAIGSLLLLEEPQSVIVTIDLNSQFGVLAGRRLFVKLETADAVQTLKIDPSAPRHAHSVHYQMGSQVNLKQQKYT